MTQMNEERIEAINRKYVIHSDPNSHDICTLCDLAIRGLRTMKRPIAITQAMIEAGAKASHKESENFIAEFETGMRVQDWDMLDEEDKKIYFDDVKIILISALNALESE